MAKSEQLETLESALRQAAAAVWVDGAREAQKTIRRAVASAQESGKLTLDEATDLTRTLELEVNCDFGERYEDKAIEAYEKVVGRPVYGQQRRVSLALPEAGPAQALASTVPPLRNDTLPSDEDVKTVPKDVDEDKPAFFRLTGFIDGLVDLPREQIVAPGECELETVVVEVKHRMGTIKDPPNIYDIVQACSYCRVFGLKRGHLVQCLREITGQPETTSSVGRLHVSPLDFSAGSGDRRGWDEAVLPSLYKVAAAVYAARGDEWLRLRLLTAPSPEERRNIVAEICPHLGR
jgi:hypothetical protein